MSVMVTLSDARTRLGELAERAARGEEIIIQRRGKPSVVLVSQAPAETPGPLGAHLAAQLGNRYRLTTEQQTRLEVLAAKNQDGALSADEHREMMNLLDDFGNLTVKRAQAISEMP